MSVREKNCATGRSNLAPSPKHVKNTRALPIITLYDTMYYVFLRNM
jgi:hypothetical protein